MLVLKKSKYPNSIVNFCIPKPKAAWWFIKPEITDVISIGGGFNLKRNPIRFAINSNPKNIEITDVISIGGGYNLKRNPIRCVINVNP